jgi:hypothetical protein
LALARKKGGRLPLTLSLSKGETSWFDRRSTELTPKSHHERFFDDYEKLLLKNNKSVIARAKPEAIRRPGLTDCFAPDGIGVSQ